MKPVFKILLAVTVLAAAPMSAAHAQNMSGAEKQAMLENMLKADTNNDGILYLSEFEMLMKLNAEDDLGKSAIVVRTGAYGRVFKRLDANGDGALTKEEAQQFAEERG